MKSAIKPYGRVWDITTSRNSSISLTDIAVYGYLSYRSGSSGSCYPTQTRIAADLHTTPKTIQKVIKNLAAAHFIKVSALPAKKPKTKSYFYTLIHPENVSYGFIRQRDFSAFDNLSTAAIGLFTFLISSSRDMDAAFKLKDLANKLNVSVNTLRKYIAELVSAGELSTLPCENEGVRMTRFIVSPSIKNDACKNAVQTVSKTKFIDKSSLITSKPDLTTPINRDEYLSLDGCESPNEALSKQNAIIKELSDLYGLTSGVAAYQSIKQQLTRFVSGRSCKNYMDVITKDLRCLLVHIDEFPRVWLTDPIIRSCAIDGLFNPANDTDAHTAVRKQLFWILGTDDQTRNILLELLNNVVSGKKDAKVWFNILAQRIKTALETRAIRCPAAYVRRIIINWLLEKRTQTSDTITYLADAYEIPQTVPQTYNELVAHSICDKFRPLIDRLPMNEYRNNEQRYNAIIKARAMAGSPVSMYDIATDEEILDLYCIMPSSYYGLLGMIEPSMAEAILRLPSKDISCRAAAYLSLPVSRRCDVLWDYDLCWLVEADRYTRGVAI